MKFGCDEAGRGPVLGSMFVACVKGSENAVPDDFDDSKKFTNNQIRNMKETVENSSLEYSVIEVTTDEIDSADSLTELSAKAFGESILQGGVKDGDSGYIDCFTNDEKKAENLVRKIIGEDISVTAEFSADEKKPLVSAASIIAKSHREEHVGELSKEYGDIGSGYPSDPNTRRFLTNFVRQNGQIPEFARSSWSTSQDILDEYGN